MKAIVSAEPLIGVSRTSNAHTRYYRSVFQNEDKVKILLAQWQSLGLKTFLCPSHHQLLEILGDSSRVMDVEIYPILLDAAQYSKAIQNYGMVGFARRQLTRIKIPHLPGIAYTGVRYLPKILRRDFRYASLLLASMEMASFGRFPARVVFLHPQVTDLALANDNGEFFRLFARFVRSRYKVEAGLMTNNIGVLLDRLDKWSLDITHVAGPVNRRGYHMKPDQSKCEELIAKTKRTVIATELSFTAIPTEDDLTYLNRLGVSSFVVELGDIMDALRLTDLLAKFP